MTTDEKYMARCLQLARLGKLHVAPNPMVGAVIVVDGKIIGEGFHQKYGQAHAEPNAIKQVKKQDLLTKATLYVNLEPCSHFGKTPPCANLIISKKIKRVVIGTLDPNPKVAGKGVELLQSGGVEVTIGILEKESIELNKAFFCFQNNKRPYILLKWAQTADGFLDKQRKEHSALPLKISNAVTTQLTHKMRAENMAIMVGTNTAILDNPSLTVRFWSGRNPIRIVIDKNNKIPENFSLKNDQIDTIIFTNSDLTAKNTKNLTFIKFEEETPTLNFILDELYKRKIHSLMIEGGAKLLNSFLEAQLWDECNIEIAPTNIGFGVKAPEIDVKYLETIEIIEKHQWLHFRKSIAAL
jgi:diaminohydroxyphosphoribosylaminopyrimidine deaminase/5-amino-6-(5-phosphoribosylamino)uracil reductase